MRQDGSRILTRLAAGQPPDVRSAPELLVGFDGVLTDWRGDLDGYTSDGGSLLRIIAAASGRGKTHLARALQAEASTRGYAVCQIDAAADHTDDDLALYRAFCAGLRHPDDVQQGNPECGLPHVLRRVALEGVSGKPLAEADVRKRIAAAGDLPIPALAEFLPALLSALRLAEVAEASRERQDDIDVVLALIAGEQVENTRALGRLRSKYTGPLLRRLRKVPGKRDARLWLETLLRVIPQIGFRGILWILDEHDEASRTLLDRHIVQLRRFADRLAEGRMVGVFAVYLVLDDFGTRIKQSHGALDQRLRPILPSPLTRRVLAPLDELRGVPPDRFFSDLGQRLHSLVGTRPMSAELRRHCEAQAVAATKLGGVDVRSFVQSVAARILDGL